MQKTKKLLTIGITAIVFLWMLAMMPAPASAVTFNVPIPYSTIQAAINAAEAAGGGTVLVAPLVAPDTYTERIVFGNKAITVKSTDPDPAATIIDGGGTGDVVTFGRDEDNSSVLDGFTIRGGTNGIYNDWFSSPTITNNIITGSVSGILNFMASPIITNNTITGNNDSGIYNFMSSPTITNNIITWNDYGISNSNSSPTISYNDVWGNLNNYYDAVTSEPFDPLPGIGEICADPLFVDAIAGDYHLEAESPCIDAGWNEALGLPATDSDGNTRIVDGDGDDVAVVDMGAFEYSITGDVNAVIDIDPDTLNLKSRGKWITAYIKLAEGYSVEDIDIDTVTLQPGEDEVTAEWGDVQEDVLMVKFDRSEVQDILEVGEVELTVTGELDGGSTFEASDTIRVINKGKK